MTDPLSVAPGERRVVRVFALDMPPAQVRFLRDEPGAVADVLGVPEIEPSQVDIITLADLDVLGLPGYLIDGCDVAPEEIAAARDRLAGLKGHVMVVLSRAFGQSGRQLAPAPPLRLVAAFGQRETDWRAAPLAAQSARPGRAAAVPPRAARGRARRIGGAIFAAFMLAILLVLAAVLW